MGKNCAQAVGTSGRNAVDGLPHLPHICVQSPALTGAVCTKPYSFAAVVRAERTVMYTGANGSSPRVNNWLSPVSTAPIITTITYI